MGMTQSTESYRSIAYGLAISSPFPLLSSSLKESEQENQSPPDIVVRQGDPNDYQNLVGNGHSLFIGAVPEFGKFIIRDGQELIVCPKSGLAIEELRAIILGSAMSVLLQQRDLLVLHASSVAIAGQAVAFLGNSGWGKSTLVSVMNAKGHDFITDDVLPICLSS